MKVRLSLPRIDGAEISTQIECGRVPVTVNFDHGQIIGWATVSCVDGVYMAELELTASLAVMHHPDYGNKAIAVGLIPVDRR